jgi:hypothetical protein
MLFMAHVDHVDGLLATYKMTLVREAMVLLEIKENLRS